MKIVVVGSSNTDLIVQANRAPRAGVSVTCLGHENGRSQCCSHGRYSDYA